MENTGVHRNPEGLEEKLPTASLLGGLMFSIKLVMELVGSSELSCAF